MAQGHNFSIIAVSQTKKQSLNQGNNEYAIWRHMSTLFYGLNWTLKDYLSRVGNKHIQYQLISYGRDKQVSKYLWG